MAFNRYEILTEHYISEIENWNWKVILKEAKSNCYLDEEEQIIGQCYLGSVLSLYPSGKIYAPWTSNQTKTDETKDSCFVEALEEVAGRHGMYIGGSEGDSDSVFACREFDIDDGITFTMQEDYDRAQELFNECEQETEEESRVS